MARPRWSSERRSSGQTFHNFDTRGRATYNPAYPGTGSLAGTRFLFVAGGAMIADNAAEPARLDALAAGQSGA